MAPFIKRNAPSPPHNSPSARSSSDEAVQPQKRRRLAAPLIPSSSSDASPERDDGLQQHSNDADEEHTSGNTNESASRPQPRIKLEPVERWAVIDAVYGSPSPPHSPVAESYGSSSAIKIFEKRSRGPAPPLRESFELADAGCSERSGPSHSQSSRAQDAAHLTTINSQAVPQSKAAPATSIESTQTAHDDSGVHLPEYPGKGKTWSDECNAAFIKYCAQDQPLRDWATGETIGGEKQGLDRFCELTGTFHSSIKDKVRKWRDQYDTFKRLLTPTGQSTLTSQWRDPTDWSMLQSHKATDPASWIRNWHDQLVVKWADATATASASPPTAPSPSHQSHTTTAQQGPSIKLRPSPEVGPSGSHVSHAAASPAPATSVATTSKRSARELSFKPDKPGNQRSQKHKYKPSKPRPSEEDLVSDIKEHERQLAELEEEGRQRDALMAEQSKLIRLGAQRNERQFQRSDRQQEVFDNLMTRLDGLIAMVSAQR